MMSWPWNELGLTGPAGPEEVKHAYAQRLKEVHPEEDPEGFQRLHRAYQMARRLSRTAAGSAAAPPESEVSAGSSDARQGASSPEEAQLDFDALLAQGEAETEPDEEDPEDEFSEDEYAWVPPVYREPLSRQPRPSSGRAIFVLIPILLLIMAILYWPSWFHGGTAAKAAKTQQWLEHTFQIQLVSSSENRNREEDRFLYWLKDDPDVRFQGIWSEDGDFQTNYPNVRLFWEMRAFAQEWPDYPLWFDQEMTDQVGEGAQGGSPPILFLFQVPLEGAEEFLCALGDELEALAQTDWYTEQPPEYLVALAHGKAILCSYSSFDRDMPTSAELLSYYQTQLCGPLLEDLLFQQDVVLWDYPTEENLIWANTGEGSVLDEKGWWISCRGTGRDGTDLTMYYFLRADYTALYCIPSDVLDNLDEGFVLSCTETRTMSCRHAVEIYRIL